MPLPPIIKHVFLDIVSPFLSFARRSANVSGANDVILPGCIEAVNAYVFRDSRIDVPVAVASPARHNRPCRV